MRIFLAGAVSGNLKPAMAKLAKRKKVTAKGLVEELFNEGFLAGGESRHSLIQEMLTPQKDSDMKVFMAGTMYGNQSKAIEALGADILLTHKPYILESFYYADETTEKLIPLFGDFLLDSGAFTFMMNKKIDINMDEYVERYAEFIVRNRIKKYFEMDIDVVSGYPKVLEYRKRLESLTGVKCIPVWHRMRGKEEFLKMCDEYDYVAIGGNVSGDIVKKDFKYFPWFIREAHKRGAKVHGLGFTSMAGLKKYHFDSVDSTSWTSGNRFGHVWKFDGSGMAKYDKPEGTRIGDSRRVAMHNFVEWVKFQKWAESNL